MTRSDPPAARPSAARPDRDRLAPRPDATAADIDRLMHDAVPQSLDLGISVEAITPEGAVARYTIDPRGLRPGGTISGPVMFALADTAMYAAVLARLDDGLMAVTSEMSLRFLRRPPPADLLGRAEIVRFGRRQVVMEVRVYSEGDPNPVALMVGTYALPG